MSYSELEHLPQMIECETCGNAFAIPGGLDHIPVPICSPCTITFIKVNRFFKEHSIEVVDAAD